MGCMIYVGPYLKITVDVRVVKTDKCMYPSACGAKTGATYCASCGLRLSQRFKTEMRERVDMFDMAQECNFEVALCRKLDASIEYVLISFNPYELQLNGCRPFIEMEDEGCEDWSRRDYDAETVQFEELHREGIEKLRKAGVVIGELGWGLVQRSS